MSNDNFEGAHDFVYNQTINVAQGSGIKALSKASMPEAFHDSGSRDPPRCHSKTRVDVMEKISGWDSSTSQPRILWVKGQAGVGKSAIAQTYAERLAKDNHLGAALFFSCANKNHDPQRLFTSLSYQIATNSSSFRKIVDCNVQNDRFLVGKSLELQFLELFIKPLRKMRDIQEMKEYVIIIDGLDECAETREQQKIIEIVADSVREETTPFRWAFFSRPEPHIVTSFASDLVHPSTLHIDLPVSRDTDLEILHYLTTKLKNIGTAHSLLSWPSNKDLKILVDRSAGLFIYASTVVQVIDDRDSWGPEAQLRHIISLTEQAANKISHPLLALDSFYELVLKRVPANALGLVLEIILLNNVLPSFYHENEPIWLIANILGLSEQGVRNACAALASVLTLKAESQQIEFYHPSFIDFLNDPQRSREYSIYETCLDNTRQDLLERLNRIHAQSAEGLAFDLARPSDLGSREGTVYGCCIDVFFHLCSYPRPLASETAAGLVGFQFMMIPRLYSGAHGGGSGMTATVFRQNIPAEFRDKVIRRSFFSILHCYVLGRGGTKAVCWSKSGSQCYIRPYPSILKF